MKTATRATTWWLALAFLAAGAAGASAQSSPPDSAWKSRLAQLQEEHDAQAGVSVSIVFDDSASMNDNHKLVMAKQAFRAWIEHARDDYRFGLLAINAGELVKLRRNDRAEILDAVEKMRAAGTTPLADTIARAAAEIRQRRAAGAVYERQVVVVLTDGEDNSRRGIPGVQEEMRRLRAECVEVIAFGYQGEGEYMRGCATHFYSPENEQDIGRGLNAIASEVLDTSDVVVDDATRGIMRALPVAAALQSVPVEAAATPKATPAPKPGKTGGFGWVWVVALVLAFVLRGAFAGNRKANRR